MSKIKNIYAREILDSRGNPTVEAEITLENGVFARACVPSGASTGEHEAVELRDKDQSRYFGKGVKNAVKNVNSIIAPRLFGQKVDDQSKIDKTMIELDGTSNKSKLGANAILAVSLASFRAAANNKSVYIFENIYKKSEFILPVPMMNILNGGSHADNNVDIQEFMIVPVGANSFRGALQMGAEIFHTLKGILKKNKLTTSVGDEGGFAPNLKSNEDALILLSEATEKAGYKLDKDIKFALDVAASEFYNSKNNLYSLHSEAQSYSSGEMIDYYQKLCDKYPIISIEDGLDQNDWDGWIKMNSALGDSIQLVGDDLTVTNIDRLQHAINKKAMNAILIKLNQIGTVTETLEAISLAQKNNFGVIISHRSGETEDVTIADLAVGTNAGQIKTGSLARTDRVAKYNQLLRIEDQLLNKSKMFSFKI
ncbi:MAG: phosphopyruvate hydratase [Candidatus Marinimicrobia bacterium]|nr:phosphopyruvate hydratase [Candidatus Neomarinimicrobiota bacterium]|tara:strand:+ start:8934 stop:10208 length:1275 start_codon:yes stop_codon:yes gene_type:complete